MYYRACNVLKTSLSYLSSEVSNKRWTTIQLRAAATKQGGVPVQGIEQMPQVLLVNVQIISYFQNIMEVFS